MIEINLLPDDLKLKVKKEAKAQDAQKILYFVPLLFAVLAVIHIYLIGVLVIKNFQLTVLNRKWRQFEPQKKNLEAFQKEYSQLSTHENLIQQLTAQRINWSDKLNRLSQHLPHGVWFNELTLSNNDLILKGSVISLQKEEIGLLNKFIDDLRSDAAFFKDFGKLELGSVQRRKIGGYDIIDFVLTANLKWEK